MKYFHWKGLVLVGALGLTACSEELAKPNYGAQPAKSAQKVIESPINTKVPEVPEHNLSRVANANAVTQAQLDALLIGKSQQADVIALLGDNEPFTLGGGKQILRYNVGKFIFDDQGVLIRKFLNN